MIVRESYDVAVVGAGPAGLVAGLAMAHVGLKTAVIGPKSDGGDGRTTALFQASIDFLKTLDAWTAIAPIAEPIGAIRLVDATGHLLSGPEVTFSAKEIGLEAFGYNVPTGGLTEALELAIAGRAIRGGAIGGGAKRLAASSVEHIEISEDHVELQLGDGGVVSARLAVGADGRRSLARAAAGISIKSWEYDQTALVCTFAHSRPHYGISTEFHRRSGPLTLVPLPGRSCGLVWVEQPERAQRAAGLPDGEFLAELSRLLKGLLGTLSGPSRRRVFPLSGLTAQSFGRNRVGLIGEAAHVIPPIGAQGLNLSFRDAATLAELAGAAYARGEDIGGAPVLEAFERRRRPDVASRVWTIDALNRSLLSGLLPVHLARGAGIAALSAFGPLRRLVMREGIAPRFATPSLMRPGATLSTGPDEPA